MDRGLLNRNPGRFWRTIRYRHRLVLGAMAVLLGTGLYYLAFEQTRDDFQHERDATIPAVAGIVGAERDYASAEDAGIADRQARSLAPDRTGPVLDSLHGRAPVSDPAGDRSQSEADDQPATADEDASADQDGKDDDDPGKALELSISGAVLDDRGSLLPGIRVEARAVGPPGQSRKGAGPLTDALTQMTDGLGGFVFEPLAEGEYQLSVEDTEKFYGVGLRVRAGVTNAELRVQRIREVRVHGQIIDETGGALESVRVRDLGGSRASPSDVDGAYEITVEPVKAGQAPVLEFGHPRYRSQRRRVEAVVGSDADAVRLDVEMEPTGEEVAVLGHVSGPRGSSVPDAEVWLSSAAPRNYQSTRTNEGGEFEFERVEVGEAYRLGVNPGPDYMKYVSEPFAVGPGNTAHDVRLEAGGYGSLSGRLINPEGRALSQFTVWLRSEDSGGGQAPIPVASDAAGNFQVEQVPAGTLRLESTSQPRLQAGGIELKPGEARHVEVPLDWGERWMFGQLLDIDGQPVAGAKVTLQWSRQHHDISSSSHRRAASDFEGFFTFSNLSAGDYRVTVQAPGFQTLRRTYGSGSEELKIVLRSSTAVGGNQ